MESSTLTITLVSSRASDPLPWLGSISESLLGTWYKWKFDIQVNYWYNTCMKTEKQTTQRFMLYLPLVLLERLRQSAKYNHRSANAEAIVALEQYLDQQEKQKKP